MFGMFHLLFSYNNNDQVLFFLLFYYYSCHTKPRKNGLEHPIYFLMWPTNMCCSCAKELFLVIIKNRIRSFLNALRDILGIYYAKRDVTIIYFFIEMRGRFSDLYMLNYIYFLILHVLYFHYSIYIKNIWK